VEDIRSDTGMLDACFKDGTAPETSDGLVTKAVVVDTAVKRNAAHRNFMVTRIRHPTQSRPLQRRREDGRKRLFLLFLVDEGTIYVHILQLHTTQFQYLIFV
jgi:hypothetical protein